MNSLGAHPGQNPFHQNNAQNDTNLTQPWIEIPKSKFGFLKIVSGNKGVKTPLEPALRSVIGSIAVKHTWDKIRSTKDRNWTENQEISIIFACLCVLEGFSSLRGLRCMQDPKNHQIWVFSMVCDQVWGILKAKSVIKIINSTQRTAPHETVYRRAAFNTATSPIPLLDSFQTVQDVQRQFHMVLNRD